MNEREIFNAALAIEDPEKQAAFLDQACGNNTTQRERLQELLAAEQRLGSFLNFPPPGVVATDIRPVTEHPGDTIGPYKLLQQIGEGGMGTVFMAEQTEPVERQVALKIIKPGMDTQQVIARFEAERQALAMMDHPNIAKVHDAGTTDSGRPYFAMELVKGVPITDYCDDQHLTPKERLELFIPICQAIQHAHQKGIIHRDLKPSNILVAQYDGKPVTKVIDFGVAKAIRRKLTEKTMFTQYGQIVGTVDYMSPEQAQFNELDVDTRSDVYSLGVLLYELLTGETPFDKQRLRSAAFDELLRIIRDEEPPKPSTRLSGSETLATTAANRKTEPKKLSLLVRGELDWIAMKALEKDRSRRYETASKLAEDVSHFLNDEPVEACPPSAGYRFRKFVKRNKAPMAVASTGVVLLMAVTLASMIAASRFRQLASEKAELAEHNANLLVEGEEALKLERVLRGKAQDAAKVAKEKTDVAERALAAEAQQRRRAQDNFALARSSVDKFLNQVVDNELLSVPGLQPLRRELLSSAMEFYDRFARDEENAMELLVELASAHDRIARIRQELGQSEQARESNERSIKLFEQLRKDGNESLEVKLGLANACFWAKRYDETVILCQEILEADPQDAETRSLLAETYNAQAIAKDDEDDIAAALEYHKKALTIREGLVRDFSDNPEYLAELGGTINNLGVLHSRQGDYSLALRSFERAVGLAADAFSREPHTILWGRWLCISLRNVAFRQAWYGRGEQALQSYQRVVAIRRRLQFDNPAVPSLHADLYRAWIDLGRHQRSLNQAAEADESFAAAENVLASIDADTPDELFDLAVVYGALATPLEGSAEQPDEQQATEQRRNADRAMQAIVEAVEKGFRNVDALKSHEYLAVIRKRDEFQKLIRRLNAEIVLADDTRHGGRDLDGIYQAVDALRPLINSDAENVSNRLNMAMGLHSIGVIETRLRNFDAAEEALREELAVREELHQEDRESVRFNADLGSAHVALGDVFWKSERFPEALQRWKTALDFLDTSISLAPHDDDLKMQVAEQELTISERYAEIGLWQRASGFSARHLGLEKTPNAVRYSWLLLAIGDIDGHRDFSRRLYDRWRESRPISALWSVAIAPEPILNSDELVALADEVSAHGDQHFTSAAVAWGYYRAGEYQKALDVLQPTSKYETSARYAAYLLAMILHKSEHFADARRLFENGERDYQSEVLRCLTDPRGLRVYGGGWWELVYAQIARREAWRVVRGQDRPGDPWQHAIQSKAWERLGHADKAESERAAALDDYDWLIRQMPERADRLRAERGFLLATHAWEQGDIGAAAAAYFPAAGWWFKNSAANQDLAPLQQAAAELFKGVSDEEFVQMFTELINQSPDLPEFYQERASAYARLGQFEQAADDFDSVLENLLDAHQQTHAASSLHQRLFERLERLENCEEVFERLAALRPGDTELWIERGRFLAFRNQFVRAADQYARVIDLNSPRMAHPSHGFEYACLLVLSGKLDRYRQLRQALMAQVEASSDYQNHYTAFLCTLLPDEDIDTEWLIELFKRDEERKGHVDYFAQLAAIEYRNGNYQEARELLEQAWDVNGHLWWVYYLTALVHHGCGDSGDASRKWYDRGNKHYQQIIPTTPGERIASESVWLTGLLWFQVQRREALLEFDPPQYHQEMAAEYARQERWDEAAQEAARALEFVPVQNLEPWKPDSIYQNLFEQLNNDERLFNRLATLRPADRDLWIERGRYLTLRSDWQPAADCYAHVIDLEAPHMDHGSHGLEYACLLVLSGRRDQHKTLCLALQRQSTTANDYDAFHIGRTLAVSGSRDVNPEAIVELIRRGEQLMSQNTYLYPLLSAKLLAAHYSEVISQFEIMENRWPCHTPFLLALAYQGLGQSDVGRKFYETGVNQLDLKDSSPAMWVRANVLYREAMHKFEPEKWQELYGAEE